MDIANWTTTLEESFEASFKLFMTFLPKSIGALLLLGLGILFGENRGSRNKSSLDDDRRGSVTEWDRPPLSAS